MSQGGGEPIDGLIGLSACCFVLTYWIAPGSGAAAEGYLVLAGLTSARAARAGLAAALDFYRFAIWRSLRFGPSLLAGLGLYVLLEATLIEFGMPPPHGGGLGGFITANPPALLPAAALFGAFLCGGAHLAGLFAGRPGRARLAALYTGLATLGLVAGFPEGSFAEAARSGLAALIAGMLLESVNASSRVARGLRRIKTKSGDRIEAAALTVVMALFLFADGATANFAPLMLAGCFLLFLRRRHRLSAWLASPFCKALGAQASPTIASVFLIVWPIAALEEAGLARMSPAEAALAAPVIVLTALALGRAMRRLVDDPARDFALTIERRVRAARTEEAHV